MVLLWVPALTLVICCGVSGERTNMCYVDGCNCSKDGVSCSFNGELILNSEFQLHLNTTSFNITLSEKAQLVVQKDFFRNNEVQLLQVTGGERFLLALNAMDGNSRALFMQIKIVGCYNVIFEPRAFVGQVNLSVTDVKRVWLFYETFYGTGFQALFLRVANLWMAEGVMHGANISSRVNVMDSHVDNLLPLQMSIGEIQFDRSTIQRIKENAFNGTEVGTIEFRNCRINDIEALAFPEMTNIDSMNFTGCTIDWFETGAIKSVIRSLIFENNTITRIHTAAIAANVVKLQVIKNTIMHADELWLTLDNWSNVSIATNSFGQFGRIYLAVVPKQEVVCAFRDNLVAVSLNECLYFGYASCAIKNITFNQHCQCDQPWPRQMFLDGPRDGQLLQEINCLVDEPIRSCYNKTHLKASEHQQVCNDKENNKTMDCAIDQRTHVIIEFPSKLNQVATIISLVVVVLSAVLLFAAIVWYKHCQTEVADLDASRNKRLKSYFINFNDAIKDIDNVYEEPLTFLPRCAPLSSPVDREKFAVCADSRVQNVYTIHENQPEVEADIHAPLANKAEPNAPDVENFIDPIANPVAARCAAALTEEAADLDAEIERLEKRHRIGQLRAKLEVDGHQPLRPSLKKKLTFTDVQCAILPFTGDDTAVPITKWLTDYDRLMDSVGADATSRLLYARRLLGGSAAMWMRSTGGRTWPSFKQDLVTEFDQRINRCDIYKQLNERCIRADEPIRQYIQHMQSLGNLIDIDEEELVLLIVDGLRDASPAIGILYSIQSIAELRKRLPEYERRRSVKNPNPVMVAEIGESRMLETESPAASPTD